MKIYISFGQSHVHGVNKKIFDKDCLCEIECNDFNEGREKAFSAFGPKFHNSYMEHEVEGVLRFFPKGIKKLN